MLFVGPNDLALSLGTTVPQLLDDRSERSALQRIAHAAQANGLPAGAYGGDPDTARRFAERGFTFVVRATDVWLLHQGARSAFAPS
jgi:2-keto-3-deoxy-L-rhamnonate aldolase RhmA